jgi:hypothetical protein
LSVQIRPSAPDFNNLQTSIFPSNYFSTKKQFLDSSKAKDSFSAVFS